MRAFATDRHGSISDLSLRDLPRPSPGPGELLVELRAAALNPADLKVLSGRDGGSFLHASTFPLTLGFDFSGAVVELGAGAAGFAVGDEVFGFLPYARKTKNGSYAEFIAVSASQVGKKAKAASHEEAAAAATAGATALQALRDKGRITAGKSVLINGASGGVGCYAVQIGKNLGAHVSALASAAKAEFVTGLGADRVYDYKTTPIEQIAERFDLVFDVVANAAPARCLKLLKPGGAFVTTVPSAAFLLGLAGALFTGKRCSWVICQPRPADFDQLSAWFEQGKLKSPIEKSWPLAEVPQALERLRSGQARGKLAVTIR